MEHDFVLTTSGLTKSFRKEKVVDDVSLQVRRNSIYGLLGPNGAGKSTTLKMLTGLLRVDSGDITFDSHPWSRRDLAQIGALIEHAPLYGNLTASENLKVHTTLLGLPDSRTREVLEIVGLAQTGNKRAAKFSMGMKQRLGIAIAILNKPKLLILDEPTNGLDPIGIQELRSLIRSFPEQGMTVILSSHMLSEVELIADDIGIITDGQLSYQGKMPEKEQLEQLFMKIFMNSRDKAGKLA